MTQAAGGLRASPADPLDTVLANVQDPGRLDQTAERLKKSGLVSGAGNFTVNNRDGLGRVTSYTDAGGTTFTVTYGNFGPVTISGGGQIRTYSYNSAGQMTGCVLS